MNTATIEPGNPAQAEQVARQAAEVLSGGGLVVFPTETVYGVAASAASDAGMAALRELRAARETRSFTVHLPDAAAAGDYVDLSAPPLHRLVGKLFPGPVTLVVESDEQTITDRLRAMGVSPEARDRMYDNRAVGLRCPDHPVTRRMLGAMRGPVVAGSATPPGERAAHDAQAAVEAVHGRVDLVIDGGRCRFAKPSTVVRVRGQGDRMSVTVEREGVYDERIVRKLLRWTVLLICSGNTCRSPMAEAIARKLLAQRRNGVSEDVEGTQVRVLSAGAFAVAGMPASAEAVTAMRKLGIDMSTHRSRPLTRELIQEADVIYCMTESHRRAVVELLPSATDKTRPLEPEGGDIADPMGADAVAYEQAADQIRRSLEQRLNAQAL